MWAQTCCQESMPFSWHFFFFSITFCSMVGYIHRGPREVHESHGKLPLQVRNHHRRISSYMSKFLNFPIETWDPRVLGAPSYSIVQSSCICPSPLMVSACPVWDSQWAGGSWHQGCLENVMQSISLPLFGTFLIKNKDSQTVFFQYIIGLNYILSWSQMFFSLSFLFSGMSMLIERK